MLFKICTVLMLTLTVLVANIALAQESPGALDDMVYLDSVEAGPGEDVIVNVNLSNPQPLSSMSVPITYDFEALTLKDINFSGSRAEHFGTRIINPDVVTEINGHFVVAFIQFLEDPVPIGDGMIFSLVFQLSDSATIGTTTLIDSLFYPPGGRLELVTTDSLAKIKPAFVAGRVSIGESNRAPAFANLPEQYIQEGESLSLTVEVSDLDRDSITIALTSKPSGAEFADNGDGTATVTWSPTFLGPNSSDGSPVTFGFWASDGNLSATQQINVVVLNTNRCPVISAPEQLAVEAGDLLEFDLSAVDPDFELLSWTWDVLPSQATFNGDNPGQFSWSTNITDSGSFDLQFVATDPLGLADTVEIPLTVKPIALYTLSLDSLSVFPGEELEFDISLDNKLPVAGFNILFNYDRSAFQYLSLSNVGTRTGDFEYFVVTVDDGGIGGNLRVIGIADFGGGATPLPAGDGAIATGRLRASSDLAFAGLSIPFPFRFQDGPTNDDNTLTNTSGARINQEEIEYIFGEIIIEDIGEILIGDINLNGIAAEIGDVIYFTNYFINPNLYSFSPLQFANSDVNRDNVAATVSDLVALINMLVNGSPAAKLGGSSMTAEVSLEKNAGDVVIRSESYNELGGVLIEFESTTAVDENTITDWPSEMTMDFHRDGSTHRVILYSLNGQRIESGYIDLLRIAGDADVSISKVEMGSAEGWPVEVAMNAPVSLPAEYTLSQNYPNPFNPETQIDFSLPVGGDVELTVLNVLGQRVITLAGGRFPAGNHTVRWDGNDAGGRSVASGIYLYRLKTEERSFTRKMLLLK